MAESMTYGELLARSVRVVEDQPMKDFERAVSELIAMYRHRAPKQYVIDALAFQHELVAADDGWVEPGPRWQAGGKPGHEDQPDEPEEPVPDEQDDPEKQPAETSPPAEPPADQPPAA